MKQTEENALRNAGLENLPAEIRKAEFLTPARRSANLLSDGSFASGASEAWQHHSWRGNKEAVRLDTNQFKSAQRSIRLHAEIADDVMCAQTVRVKTNTVYLLSGWAKTEGVVIQEQSTVRKGANLSVWGGYESSASLVGDQDWTYLTVAFNSGSRTNVNLGARLGHHFSIATGTAWFDDLCLIEIKP